MHSSIHVTVRCDICPLLGPVHSGSTKIPFYTMLYLGIFLLGCLLCLVTVASQDYTVPTSWVSIRFCIISDTTLIFGINRMPPLHFLSLRGRN